MAKILRKKVWQYNAVFEPDEKDGGYTASIPSLPGCISEGDTFEEALENIKEAASLYLEAMQERRERALRPERIIIAPIQVEA